MSAANQQRARMTVLLVEDDTTLRSALAEYLTSLHCCVSEVASADEAMVLVTGGRSFDLYLADVQTPGQANGIQFASKVVQRWPDAKILVMSGSPEFLDNGNRLPTGVLFLPKPFRLSVLRDLVESLPRSESVRQLNGPPSG